MHRERTEILRSKRKKNFGKRKKDLKYYLTNGNNEGHVSKDHVKSNAKGLFLITSHVHFALLYFSNFTES